MALRALEEKSALCRRMAASGPRRESRTGSRFRDIADEAESAGNTIRRLIAQIGSTVGPVDGTTLQSDARPPIR